MKLEQITQDIFNLQAESAKELGYSFARPQEYYENAQFKGKVFSLDDFKRWWIKNTEAGRQAGKFVYCQYFEGFNIPSDALTPFRQGKFNPLSEQEQALLEITKRLPKKHYLIGTRGNCKQETLKHEISHGLYFTSPQYKRESQRIVQELARRDPSVIERLNKYLRENGYHPSVFEDERQAYLLAGDDLVDMNPKIYKREVQPEHNHLNALFNRVFAKAKTHQ